METLMTKPEITLDEMKARLAVAGWAIVNQKEFVSLFSPSPEELHFKRKAAEVDEDLIRRAWGYHLKVTAVQTIQDWLQDYAEAASIMYKPKEDGSGGGCFCAVYYDHKKGYLEADGESAFEAVTAWIARFGRLYGAKKRR